MATIDDVKASYKAIVRVDLNDAAAAATAAAIDGGQISLTQYQQSLISQAAPTTVAALALSTAITGLVPTSEKLDQLTAFAKTQNDYYTNVLKSGNAQLGAYEALGRAYATDATTTATFNARFGALSTADFVTAAYATAFSAAPTAGAIANLTAQVDYFTNLYVAAGIPAASASLQAKGAVYGQILGYAATSANAPGTPATTLDDTLNATLTTIATEAVSKTDSTIYGKALPGVGGAALTIAADQSISLDSLVANLKSTAGNDTVAGTISGATANVSVNTGAGDDLIGTASAPVTVTQVGAFTISIDGSGGVDSLYATQGSNLTTQTAIANVEKIFLDGAGNTAVATKWTGVQELWAYKTTGTTTVTDLSSGIKVGVDSSTAASSFTYKAGVASADLVLKNAAGAVTVNGTGTDLKTVSVAVDSVSTLTGLTTNAATVNVTGSVNATLGAIDTGVKTLSAADYTGNLTLTLDPSVTASKYTLGSGADVVTVDFSNASIASSFTFGAGNDTIKVALGTFGNASADATKFATFTDFTKGADKLQFTDLAAADVVDIGAIAGVADLAGALTVAAANANADGTKAVVFQYASNTYVYNDVGDNGYGAGDGLIKLAGVGYTVGGANGDIVGIA